MTDNSNYVFGQERIGPGAASSNLNDIKEGTQKGHLLSHIKSRHEGVKFPCDQCDYKATQKRILLTHIKSIHEGIKFPCDRCDYKATTKGNLLTHI